MGIEVDLCHLAVDPTEALGASGLDSSGCGLHILSRRLLRGLPRRRSLGHLLGCGCSRFGSRRRLRSLCRRRLGLLTCRHRLGSHRSRLGRGRALRLL